MILIASDGYHAHYFERMAWINALTYAGIPCELYDCKQSAAFDVFDSLEPSIFIGQSYNLDRATIKCIKERPHMKVVLRAGHYCKDKKLMENPHMLAVTNEEIKILTELSETTGKPDIVYCHYLQEDIDNTHELFLPLGIKALGLPMSADVLTYMDGSYDQRLSCDIGFVGGYWPYKGQQIDKYLTPILNDPDFNCKVFGNQRWPHVNCYYGHLPEPKVRDLFVSAKVCPNLSEPHALEFGFDVNERAFKILAAGGFCVMDNVNAARKIFDDNVYFADDPDEFKTAIKNAINRGPCSMEYEKTFVLKNHSNFNRVMSILNALEENKLYKKVSDAHNHFIQQRQTFTT